MSDFVIIQELKQENWRLQDELKKQQKLLELYKEMHRAFTEVDMCTYPDVIPEYQDEYDKSMAEYWSLKKKIKKLEAENGTL